MSVDESRRSSRGIHPGRHHSKLLIAVIHRFLICNFLPELRFGVTLNAILVLVLVLDLLLFLEVFFLIVFVNLLRALLRLRLSSGLIDVA
jgi:hypothetical protein